MPGGQNRLDTGELDARPGCLGVRADGCGRGKRGGRVRGDGWCAGGADAVAGRDDRSDGRDERPGTGAAERVDRAGWSGIVTRAAGRSWDPGGMVGGGTGSWADRGGRREGRGLRNEGGGSGWVLDDVHSWTWGREGRCRTQRIDWGGGWSVGSDLGLGTSVGESRA